MKMHKHQAMRIVTAHGHGARIDVRSNDVVLTSRGVVPGTYDQTRFPIDAHGMVDRRAVRLWLGY